MMGEQLRLWSDAEPLHNVFFAIKPDAKAAAHVADLARHLSGNLRLIGNRVPPARLHVSLLGVGGFYGKCPASVIDDARSAAGAVAVAPFNVRFDRVACFNGGAGVKALVLTGDEGAASLRSLRKTLHRAMAERGLGHRKRSAFTPHLTMMYADRALRPVSVDPVCWTVDAFVLIDSLVAQSRHVLLGRWPRVARDEPPTNARGMRTAMHLAV